MNITFFCPIDLASSHSQALSRLLSIGKNHMVNQAMSELICQQFAVQADPDYPLAALSANVDNQASTAYYLQADPVHLILQRDAFALSDPAALAITQAELQALSEVLNQHFVADGFIFELSKQKLLLRLAAAAKMSTTLPEKVIARNVFPYLPQGVDAPYWNKVMNEMQMLLHEHPINQHREIIDLPVINGIWLSGGGGLPQLAMSTFNKVYSDISYVLKLAQLTNVVCASLPDDMKFGFNQDNVLIATESSTKLDAWSDMLYKLVQQGVSLQLNLVHQDTVLISEIKPRDVYKLWLWQLLRKNKSLIDYFQTHYSRMKN